MDFNKNTMFGVIAKLLLDSFELRLENIKKAAMPPPARPAQPRPQISL